MFHGTTDDIHKKLGKGESLLQLEDSYFKHGFFIMATWGTHKFLEKNILRTFILIFYLFARVRVQVQLL